MARDGESKELRDRYRERYLKLKTVLYDRTTGLPAFPVVLDQLRSWLDDRRHIGVVFVRVRRLDMVESLYGWQVYDRVLSRTAFVLREVVGEMPSEHTVLSVDRVAGDGFVLFVAQQDCGGEVDATHLATQGRMLRRRLEDAFAEDGYDSLGPQLDFRVGHALLGRDPFYRFERRVYAAVEEASNVPERQDRRRESSWADELREIVDEEAVDVLLQPVVDLGSQAILGYEAFSRGPRNTRFEKPLAMFALSGQVGIATELDRVCHEIALRAAASLAPRAKIFLNTLPESVGREHGTEGELLALLEALSLEPADLVLEFSERAADADFDAFVTALERARECGFGVALDDIGTGFASQSIVDRVQPDYLKLDVSLVHNIHENLIKQEMLTTLVRLAERIHAAVIAEGVERQEEATTLRNCGARYAQGFLYAMPVPAASMLFDEGNDVRDH